MREFLAILSLLIVLIAILSSDKKNAHESRPDVLPNELDELTGEPYVPDRSEGSVTSQRDKMRELFQRNAGDEEKTVLAYAVAERAGEVSRRSNDYALNAEEYARRLLNDGVRKGWIT